MPGIIILLFRMGLGKDGILMESTVLTRKEATSERVRRGEGGGERGRKGGG